MRQLQKLVLPWLYSIFGITAYNRAYRAARFLEEAIELCQAVGLDRASAAALVDYVYDREIGEPFQEMGGAMITLLGLAENLGIEAEDAALAEYIRAISFDEAKREKMRSKVRPAARLAA